MRQPATQSVSGPTTIQENNPVGSVKLESRGRPRSDESEEAILAATLQLLTEKPLRDISMEEIARKAGVGKATIYKWWPSKAYVALDVFLKNLTRKVPTPDTGSAKRDIQQQLRSAMVFYKSRAGRVLGQFLAEAQSDTEFAELFRERFLKPRREVTGAIFDRGVRRGEIDPKLDRELVIDMIYGPVVYRMMVGHAPLDRKMADRVVSTLFGGLEVAGIRGETTRKHSVSHRKGKGSWQE
jgi:AcrR family transcriptional regulator